MKLRAWPFCTMAAALLCGAGLACGSELPVVEPAHVPLVPIHAVAPEPPKAKFPVISTDDLAARLQKPARDFTLVDARSQEEFAEYHLPSAVLLPAGKVTERLGNLVPDKDREIIFYCNGPDCTKSARAAKAASDLGYTHIAEYKGGLPGWAQAKLPLEGTPLPAYAAPSLTPLDLDKLLTSGQQTTILDVRDGSEFAKFWLTGAVNIPLDAVRDRVRELPKGSTIVVVDHAGHQRAVSARLVHSLGFDDVRALEGGLIAWQQDGLPVQRPTPAESKP